jgi:hypothetical protein
MRDLAVVTAIFRSLSATLTIRSFHLVFGCESGEALAFEM